jgi:hypothetical protein
MTHRVRSSPLRLLLAKDTILLVGGQGVRVGAVGVQLVDIGDEALVKEELSNVRNSAAGQSAVRNLGGVLVNDDMDVRGAAGVLGFIHIVSSYPGQRSISHIH